MSLSCEVGMEIALCVILFGALVTGYYIGTKTGL